MSDHVDLRSNSVRIFDPTRLSICVIGAGAGGGRFFDEITKQVIADGLADSVAITLLDARPIDQHGRGVAWTSDQSPSLRANMHTHTIGYDPNDSERLRNALGVDLEEQLTQNEMFRSRKEVGDALARDLQTNIAIARNAGIAVDQVQGEAAQLRKKGAGYTIELTEGADIFAHFVVFALGHIPPTNFKELESSPAYYGNPWDWNSLSTIARESHVGIIGLGPTAVDVMIVLKEMGIKRISAFSRNGKVQYPRPRYHAHELKVCTPERIKSVVKITGSLTLDTVITLIVGEFQEAGVDCKPLWKAFENSEMDPESSITLGLKDCRQTSDWFSILKAIDDVTPLIWHLLSHAEREKYLKAFRRQHTNVSYGSASPQAMRMLDAIHDGTLEIFELAGNIVATANGFTVPCRRPDVLVGRGVDCIVNCSGVGTDLSKARFPLLRTMIETGWLTPHPYGGALVDFGSGQILKENGHPIGNLYSLVGSMTYGTHLLTHCLGETGKSAHRTATAIHKSLRAYAAPQPNVG